MSGDTSARNARHARAARRAKMGTGMSNAQDDLNRYYTAMMSGRPAGVGTDIVARLRSQSKSNLAGFLPGDLFAEAASEIERLRRELRLLKEEKSPTEQRAIGYAEAQRDMRKMLGIED